MELTAHFSDIREAIQRELNSSQNNIIAAVAWLTDAVLFKSLVQAARRGVDVRIALLDDKINRNAALSRESLTAAKGECYWIPESGRSVGSLHHKFCVIDSNIVITGSYNWTHRASVADENIIISYGDLKLVNGYSQAFEALLKKHGHAGKLIKNETSLIQKRLEVIHNLLLLEDYNALSQQLLHLEKVQSYPLMMILLDSIQNKEWSIAEQTLRNMLDTCKSITIYESSELLELRLNIRELEVQIIAFSTEQTEIEQVIDQFNKRQNHIIGAVLRKYLRLRESVFAKRAIDSGNQQDNQLYKDAKEAYQAYQESYATEETLSRWDTLTFEEQRELKQIARKARWLCHPDRVSELEKGEAQIAFNQVQKAYQTADFSTLKRLYYALKQGKPFEDLSEVPMEVTQLRQQVVRLRLESERYISAIHDLRQSDTFKKITDLNDWNSYFAKIKQELEDESEKLQYELDGEIS